MRKLFTRFHVVKSRLKVGLVIRVTRLIAVPESVCQL